MSGNDETEDEALDLRTPSASDYDAWRQGAIRRAHRLRSRHALAVLVRVVTAVSGMARAALAMLNRLSQARADRQAIARLHALDDGALKDIGIRRSEIESVVHGHGVDETRMRRDQRLAA